jgi:tetratricopeptide (TPR) repeat protein
MMRPSRWFLLMIALGLAAASWLVIAGPYLPWPGRPDARWLGRTTSAAGRDFAYRFPRVSRQEAVRALEREIAFHQARIARDPQGGLDLAALAGAYLRMGRLTGEASWYLLAEQAATSSLARLPFDNPGALVVLARVAEARHDFDRAIALARRAGPLDEALAVLVTAHLGRDDARSAAAAAETLVGRMPTLSAYTLRALAREALGQEARALRDFHDGLAAEEPGEVASSAWARTLLGRFHVRRGELQSAERLYRQALEILPRSPMALLLLADLEVRVGRWDEAKRHYWQVLSTTPGAAFAGTFDHSAYQGVARLRALQGRRDEAEVLWERAERLIRSHLTQFGHRRELARLLLERGRPDNMAEALRLARAEAWTRRDPDTLDTLAWALSAAGGWAEADAVAQAVLRSGGAVRPAALVRAALIAQALGRHAAAQRLLRQALRRDPTFDHRARQLAGLAPLPGGEGR